MTKDEALILALEALMYASYEDIEYDATCATKVLTARNAIKEVLTQPEQEPVAFYNPQHGGFYWAKPTTIHAPQAVDIMPLALYTSPPQRQEEQEPVAMHEDWYDSNSCGHCGMVGGHINTCRHYTSPPQPTIKQSLTVEQEPVAWWDAKLGVFDEKHFDQLQPLFTAPPRRQPLTDEKRNFCFRCGKRLHGVLGNSTIHTCTPPMENT